VKQKCALQVVYAILNLRITESILVLRIDYIKY